MGEMYILIHESMNNQKSIISERKLGTEREKKCKRVLVSNNSLKVD